MSPRTERTPGYVYVAQVAMGANPAQTLKAIHEADGLRRPRPVIIGYSPCEMHSIKKGGMQNCQAEMKAARRMAVHLQVCWYRGSDHDGKKAHRLFVRDEAGRRQGGRRRGA